MMRRDDCLSILAKARGNAAVISAYSAAFDWMRVSPSRLNFAAVGAMGQASSQALGMALGMPERLFIVLDGDGSLLMNLGSLVTIANAAPRNLVHFVCQNGCYEANGGHPIPGEDKVSFAGFARAAGYPAVFEFEELDDFAARLPEVLTARGPVFATLKVVPGAPSKRDYQGIKSAEARKIFAAALREIPSERFNP